MIWLGADEGEDVVTFSPSSDGAAADATIRSVAAGVGDEVGVVDSTEGESAATVKDGDIVGAGDIDASCAEEGDAVSSVAVEGDSVLVDGAAVGVDNTTESEGAEVSADVDAEGVAVNDEGVSV